MESFDAIYARAAARKGGEARLEALIADVPTVPRGALAEQTDDRVLSMMTRRVFQAGFAWRVIEQKWDGFETAFHRFDPSRCAALAPDEIDALAADTRIVRNRQKIVTVPRNAQFVLDIATEHGSFVDWLEAWPPDDTVGLWRVMNQRGSRLGGMTAAITLRSLGYDTFLLSGDVVALLVANKVVSKKPTSQRDLAAAQDAINQWCAESGRSQADVSRIGSMSVGAQRVGVEEATPFLLDVE